MVKDSSFDFSVSKPYQFDLWQSYVGKRKHRILVCNAGMYFDIHVNTLFCGCCDETAEYDILFYKYILSEL